MADKIIRNSKLDTFLSKLATKLPAIFWRKGETIQVGIDDTPTANSSNLVSSGGVFNAVNGQYIEAWDGASTPVAANIPAGVSVTYGGATTTGTLAASASTRGKIYLVSDGNGQYDRYYTSYDSSSYSWAPMGSTAMDLSGYATEAEVEALDAAINGATIIVQETVTLATIASLTNNGLIKDDGETIQASGAGIYSGYISLEGISGDLTVTGWASSNKIIFFYNAGKDFLSYALSGKNSATLVSIPPNAAFIRVNGLTAAYLEGQSSSQYATGVTGIKTTTVTEGGLVADVEAVAEDVEANTAQIAKLNSKTAGKYLHISFDDAYRILKYLDTDSPASIFEEPRMALCKQLHDTYGAVFSFYLFNDEVNPETEEILWSIESTPSTYKAQWQACCDWIKFGYHTKNRNTNANDFTVAQLEADYARTIAVIQNCIGLGSLDRCPRLGGYAGSLDRMLALRDANAGILGLFGPDDTRQGYYMTNSQAIWLRNQDRWRDYENQMVIVKTDLRLENADVRDSIATVIASWETAAQANKVRELVIFTHEGVVFLAENHIPANLEAICAWAASNGYAFDYPQNRIW